MDEIKLLRVKAEEKILQYAINATNVCDMATAVNAYGELIRSVAYSDEVKIMAKQK